MLNVAVLVRGLRTYELHILGEPGVGGDLEPQAGAAHGLADDGEPGGRGSAARHLLHDRAGADVPGDRGRDAALPPGDRVVELDDSP